MIILIWLILSVITFIILHTVIRSAIDGSELTGTLKNIEKLLQQQQELPFEPGGGMTGGQPVSMKTTVEDKTAGLEYEECPACQFRIPQETAVCPSCGITLIDHAEAEE